MDLKNEKVFNGIKKIKIKYIFEKSSRPTNYLIIVFSAFSAVGSPPAYNYYDTLLKYDCNKLFILDDYSERGCYYLGKDNDFSIENSVVSLITHIANQHSIKFDNIITCGSSKGGYAALYFAIKYGFGHVVAGAPQTLVGNFLRRTPDIIRFIVGDDSEKAIQYLNDLLYKVIENTEKLPEINIHVGEGDYHYKEHVMPFIDAINKKSHSIYLDLGNYNNHSDFPFYQRFIKRKIESIINSILIKDGFPVINDLSIDINNADITVTTMATGNKIQYAWYVFNDDTRCHVEWYKDINKFTWRAIDKGRYKILAFVKNVNGQTDSETSDYFDLQ